MARRDEPMPFRPKHVADPHLPPPPTGRPLLVEVIPHAYRVLLTVSGADCILFDPDQAIQIGAAMVSCGVRQKMLIHGTAPEGGR